VQFLSQIVSLYLPNDMLCKRWRNTNDELVPGSFIFVPGFRDKKYQSKTKCGQMPKWTGIIHKLPLVNSRGPGGIRSGV
jgi:hypothetical protein